MPTTPGWGGIAGHMPYQPPGPKCPLHPGVSWNGAGPCYVCHPTPEAEGRIEHPPVIVPDPTERYQPAVRQCVVLRDPDSDMATCKRPWDGEHTILGYAICRDCYEAVTSHA